MREESEGDLMRCAPTRERAGPTAYLAEISNGLQNLKFYRNLQNLKFPDSHFFFLEVYEGLC